MSKKLRTAINQALDWEIKHSWRLMFVGLIVPELVRLFDNMSALAEVMAEEEEDV